MSLIVAILEAQSADKALMTLAFELVIDRNWSLDNALHEVTYIRAEMSSLMQPRPRLGKPTFGAKGDSGNKGSNKGKVGGKGKGTGSGKGKGPRVQWVDGKKRQLCVRFQTGRCHLADCKFYHGCAYPIADNRPCGKAHGAMFHEQASH